MANRTILLKYEHGVPATFPLHGHEIWLRRAEEQAARAKEMTKLAREMCAQAKQMRRSARIFVLP